MAATAMNQPIVMCGRCGGHMLGTVLIQESTFVILCTSCKMIMDQETLSLSKQLNEYKKENQNLKVRQENHDNEVQRLKSRVEFYQKAYETETSDRIELRVDRDMARNAIQFWKVFLEHWKTIKACAFCSKFQPCPVMKMTEEQAVSATPEWNCETCKKKDEQMSTMRNASESAHEHFRHMQKCSKCGELPCPTGRETYLFAVKHLENALQSNGGKSILDKLSRSVQDFSFLGDYSAILYYEGEYRTLRLDPRKIQMGQIKILSTSPSLKEALEMAKNAQMVETVHHA